MDNDQLKGNMKQAARALTDDRHHKRAGDIKEAARKSK